MQMYEVGGCVRDELMGVVSKDIDYSVVMSSDDINAAAFEGTPLYEFMVDQLRYAGVTIFRDNEGNPIGHEHLTARGRMPGVGAVDFVLARKDGSYSDGRRPDSVSVGTLADDLARRDFTVNAIAKAADGTLIDPHGGQADIYNRVLRTVGDPVERFLEDGLRPLRALRFAVTKDFRIHPDTKTAMRFNRVLDKVSSVSDERKREELNKMFAHDTVRSITMLYDNPGILGAVFSKGLTLEATMKQRKN